jgi:superfamily II DNA or RNA helicase
MSGFFIDHHGALGLTKQTGTPNQGFRAGQLGALHAVLAHATVQDDPAIVCLPTGYGKTSVMMALPFLLRANRVLVVEPSDALRKQVASHYRELSTLRRIGAIPEGFPNPNVQKQEGRPDGPDGWVALEAFDVVISTPGSTSPSLAPGSASDLFDLVIFDEAHHAPADTWAAFMQHYTSARFVFLTATPFRRDGRPIPGKLVYRYPVMKAVQEGAFHPVSFVAVQVENELDDAQIDRAIAQAATSRLREDAEAGFDHRLFVRASSIAAARALVALYRELGVEVEAVDSKIGKRAQDSCERRLQSGELKGIVCVDMFGEGYDFPKLKVGALHAPHRSLVPTIQFIGRFARVDPTTGQATLIAPLSRVEDAAGALLREGVDLASMIDQAAQAEIAGHVAEQEVLERLPVSRLTESDYEEVSPLALELYAHVRVFRCSRRPDFSLVGESVGRELRLVKQWTSTDGTITLLLTVDENPPAWATSDVLLNVRHDAFLLIFFEASQLCYIGSTRRSDRIYVGLMDKVCADSFRSLSYEETSRARAGLHSVKFFNVGLKNTTVNSQGETYRTLTGPAAERAVSAGDSRAYAQGHYFGSGFDGDDAETIGASSSSRIWSNQRLTVSKFITWTERMNARVAGRAAFTETNLDIVRAATTLRRLPDTVIAANWPKVGFKANPRVRFRPVAGGPIFHRRLSEWELAHFESRPDQEELLFSAVSEEGLARMRFAIRGGQMVELVNVGVTLELESAVDSWIPLAEWLSEHPPIFYAADKSSFEGMNHMAAPLLQAALLAPGDAEVIDWGGCEISVEFLTDDGSPEAQQARQALAGQATVQEHLERHLLGLPAVTSVFYDHRTGEAADYIAVTVADGGAIDIALYHCKAAGGAPTGGRVGDVYEVAGQLVKSVFYCDVSTMLKHMEDRMDRRHRSPSTFKRGDLDTLKALLAQTPPTKLSFSVVGVQPGISRAEVDAHLADLMVFGINYARQGGASKAYWLISE